MENKVTKSKKVEKVVSDLKVGDTVILGSGVAKRYKSLITVKNEKGRQSKIASIMPDGKIVLTERLLGFWVWHANDLIRMNERKEG